MGDLSLLEGASGGRLWLLLFLLGLALAFEFVNGFHDTANAVATVIYTNSLQPRWAVILSGFCNFLGVHLGGTAVAFSIVHLLPVELLIAVGSSGGVAMVLSLLLAAIIWNVGTWSLGLPASSSHTLIGAILGIGLANSMLSGQGMGAGVNWHKAIEVGLSLLISPIFGFVCAAGLYFFLKKIASDPRIDRAPEGDEPPPWWIRTVLLLTCSGVSVAHGSNDGQKGVGLIMLILIGLLPTPYSLNPDYGPQRVERARFAVEQVEKMLSLRNGGKDESEPQLSRLLTEVKTTVDRVPRPRDMSEHERWQLRTDLIRIDRSFQNAIAHPPGNPWTPEELKILTNCRAELADATDFAPGWVIVAVATALGLGTMIGWKRIVVTIGEKIGKTHLTYAQGAAAEIVAMCTIGVADFGGLPVSTTQVLSSGVAGTMAAARAGVQFETLKKILIAWILTLPVSMLLSGGLFTVLSRVIR